MIDSITSATPIVVPPPGILPVESVAHVEQQIESLQSEITSLQDEVNILRRRDETLKFYMNRLDEEMRLAARLQQDFLPKTLPQIGKVHFHTVFRPAGYVSGDLYDVMRLDEKHVGFYMADAVGHGMPAALLTMFIKNALVTKQITADGYRLLEPSQTMAKLNDALVDQHLSHATFATAIYGHINTESLQVTFARGGHPSPILINAKGELKSVEADGSLLGIFDDEKFSNGTVQLESGDRLFIFTDGVEVAFTDSAEKMSAQQWWDELHRRRHLTTQQLLGELTAYLDHGAGSITPKDDLTIIAIDVK